MHATSAGREYTAVYSGCYSESERLDRVFCLCALIRPPCSKVPGRSATQTLLGDVASSALFGRLVRSGEKSGVT